MRRDNVRGTGSSINILRRGFLSRSGLCDRLLFPAYLLSAPLRWVLPHCLLPLPLEEVILGLHVVTLPQRST